MSGIKEPTPEKIKKLEKRSNLIKVYYNILLNINRVIIKKYKFITK